MVTRGWSSITSTIPHDSTVPAHAYLGPQPTPSTDPLYPAVTPYDASSSTAVTPAPLSASSNVVPPASVQSSSHNADFPVPVAVLVSAEELAMLQEFRRHKAIPEHLSGPGLHREPFTYPYISTSLSESRGSVSPNTSAIQPPSNPQRSSHPYPQPFHSSVGLDPLLNVVPSLRSPSVSPSRHFLTPTITSNVQSMHTMASAHNPESAAQLGMRRPGNDEDID
ncbi:hypothetical protein PAXINDRAFT_102144 [Paxillus involutus ATCC 200175]|uniref:Uncharacterized protein n=1 Tax=Paxillus involutus ATCC 200175 TaxID=664439 RepID=A0A0C9TQ17_PAXIN|nr:hypothetical protein PAXINDRAFT_102144 [Paxillus involutus ATCC 200175]